MVINSSMRYHEIMSETSAPIKKPKFLYHGTAKQFVPAIVSTGLEPRVGAYTQNWYGHRSDKLQPLVFAADKRRIGDCVLAMFAAGKITDKMISMDDFLTVAALVVLPSDTFQRRQGKFDKNHPIQVESRDWYSIEPVKPIKVIMDEELRGLIGPYFHEAKVGWFGVPSEFDSASY